MARANFSIRAGGTWLLPALGFLVGCATPDQGPPPLLRAAAKQARIGEEAYLTGHADEAIPSLAEAARLHFAAGDLPGAGRAMLNLALAQRATGDSASATATAERLRKLAPSASQQAREEGKDLETSAASAWLDALLALDRGDRSAAAELLSNAPADLKAPSPWPARIATLRAEIALGGGRLVEAVDQARSGRTASVSAHDPAEEAHALRVSGLAHIGLGQWEDARTDFLAALKIEESLGGGTRMIGDLNHLATVAEHLGHSSEAQLYAERARLIAAGR